MMSKLATTTVSMAFLCGFLAPAAAAEVRGRVADGLGCRWWGQLSRRQAPAQAAVGAGA